MTSKPVLFQDRFRSRLEERIAGQLERAGLHFNYEGETLKLVVPAREAKYLPDFVLTKKDGSKMYIEAKGQFGFDAVHKMQRTSPAAARQKFLLVRECNPGIDLRIIFNRANTPIYKGSPTTLGKWAETHGIPWADGGVVPDYWIKELQDGQV